MTDNKYSTNTNELIIITIYARACSSSPFSAISCTMSNPPTNSPLMISCGKVGQSFSFFRPTSGGRGHKYTLAVRKTCEQTYPV